LRLRELAAGGEMRASGFFQKIPGIREGRENRPQLRCGNALQTSSTPSVGARKANLRSGEGEGERRGPRAARAKPKSQNAKFQNRLRLFEPPLVLGGLEFWTFGICARSALTCGVRTSAPGKLTRFAANFAAADRENFIANHEA
jgi:hypothetical protein